MPVPSDYQMPVFWDDFDALHLDSSLWKVSDYKKGYGLETFESGNVILDNGILRLVCPNWNFSGEVSSVPSFRYGYFECRAKLPSGSGMWPAFWTLTTKVPQTDWEEIDIFENHGNHPERNYFNAHYGPRPGPVLNYQSSSKNDFDPSAGFHRYGVDWMHGAVDYYVDGVVVGQFTEPVIDTLHDQHSILLSLSISKPGSFGGGPSMDLAAYPVYLDVDYVGVWKQDKHRA